MNNVEDIAKEIQRMIDEAARDTMCGNVLYKERLTELCNKLKDAAEEAQDFYNSMQEENLNYGAVEAEGCLRAFKQIMYIVEDYHPYANEK